MQRAHGISTIAYRLGMFVPEDFVRYGFRLLKGGVDDRDVAVAMLLGLHEKMITFEAFNIMAEVPFSPYDFEEWRREPAALIEKHYPGISEMLRQRGASLSELAAMWGHTYWSIDKAKERLGFRPKYNFTEFFEALREGQEEHYPFANLPWWGV